MKLAFDIGSYTGAFSELLYKNGYFNIVAVDPLGLNKFQFNTYLQAVVAAAPGTQTLHLNSNKAISSINPTFVQHSRFANNKHYNRQNKFTGEQLQVKAYTYEELVSSYGVPELVKLDVEGSELSIIQTIKHWPQLLGFEYHQELADQTKEILLLLRKSGYNNWCMQDYTYSGEKHELPTSWLTFNQFKPLLNYQQPDQKPWELHWGMVWVSK